MRLKIALGTSLLAVTFALAEFVAIGRAALAVEFGGAGPGPGQMGAEPPAGGSVSGDCVRRIADPLVVLRSRDQLLLSHKA